MRRRYGMFYGVVMLTGVNLLLRVAGTSFQVYLSRTIGAAGVGLLQLTMSLGSFTLIAGMAGVRTAAMYLTAEELGRKRQEGLPWVLSGCIRYSLLASGAAALVLALGAGFLAEGLVGNGRIAGCLRLYAGFLPIPCLCGVFAGFFTAAGRVGTLAAVEVAEQLCSMGATFVLLTLPGSREPEAATRCVILGSGLGGCLTLISLLALRLRERGTIGPEIPVREKLLKTALPLAGADVLKSGISTGENLLVPRRLGLYPGIGDPLAAFGVISGMVFPVLMFPACILWGLADLLIPELARCNAAGSRERICYLVRRGLKAGLLYGLIFGGGMALVSGSLCQGLYNNREAGLWLGRFALMIPMLYCDALVDAMTKGLGQQKICVCFNILTSVLDVGMLFVLLPRYGVGGYYVSFLIGHGVNFLLSLGLLMKISGLRFRLRTPASCAGAMAAGLLLGRLAGQTAAIPVYCTVLGSILVLTGFLKIEDILWLVRLVGAERKN